MKTGKVAMPIPENPKIYHIVHMDRLSSIVKDGGLLCDAVMVNRQETGTNIGMSSIKQRRLLLPLPCYPDTCIGDYVPFYFCPRSVMLYVISRANHPELHYSGGQKPIVHLEADLHSVVDWADENGRRWAFSLSNAAAQYTQFRNSRDSLDEINWDAVAAANWSFSEVKDAKQAEFLVHHFFPWHLITRIGVIAPDIGNRVARAIRSALHKPRIEVQRSWYY